jgi:plasmid stabilization system protein ParE
MRPVIVDDAARDDIRDAFRWYEDRKAGLGLEFVEELDAAVATIAERPGSFPVVARTARRALVRRFPYLVLFVESGEDIGIIGVFHTARDPQTWLRRAGQRGG